jgi:quercetin dioxygenase-like cupin family protein
MEEVVPMTVVHQADTRRTETPAGVMTTLASPGQGGAQTAVWRVEMKPGVTGPVHVINVEQIWTVISGGVNVVVGDDTLSAGTGDTVILPGDATRQVTAGPDGLTAIVAAPADAHAITADGTRVVPPWIV